MTEQELSVKLAETEQRARSNMHRIEKLEQQQKDLNKLVTAVEVLASREKSVETDIKEIKARVYKNEHMLWVIIVFLASEFGMTFLNLFPTM